MRLLNDHDQSVTQPISAKCYCHCRYSPEMPPSKMAAYVRFGAWVAGVDMFDASAFRLPRAEAATLDPQHRLLLECTAAALRDGGCDTGAQTTGTRLGFGVCGCMNGMCDVHGSKGKCVSGHWMKCGKEISDALGILQSGSHRTTASRRREASYTATVVSTTVEQSGCSTAPRA